MSETAGVSSAGHQEAAPAGEAEWWVALARKLGQTVGRARAKVTPTKRSGPRRSTENLLLELGQIVSEHADHDYASLESEPRFWALVSHLHARHQEEGIRGRKPAPDSEATAAGEDAVAAEVREPSDGEETPETEEAAPEDDVSPPEDDVTPPKGADESPPERAEEDA